MYLFFTLFLLLGLTSATIWNVNPGCASGSCSLSSVVANSLNDGDTINMASGAYDITTTLTWTASNVNLIGNINAPDSVVISCGANITGISLPGITNGTHLVGFTVTNCTAGGIQMSGTGSNVNTIIITNGAIFGLLFKTSTNFIVNYTAISHIAGNAFQASVNSVGSVHISRFETSWYGARIGGEYWALNSHVDFDSCVFTQNSSPDNQTHGGGVTLPQGSSASFTSCNITNNYELYTGSAGLTAYSADFNLTNCKVNNNDGVTVGGIVVQVGTVIVKSSSISNNTNHYQFTAAGMVESITDLTMTDTVFDHNFGGALSFQPNSMLIEDCQFTNTIINGTGAVIGYGGNPPNGPWVFSRCVFDNNQVLNTNGRIFGSSSGVPLNFTHCNFTNNNAGTLMPMWVAYYATGPIYFDNCNFVGNSGTYIFQWYTAWAFFDGCNIVGNNVTGNVLWQQSLNTSITSTYISENIVPTGKSIISVPDIYIADSTITNNTGDAFSIGGGTFINTEISFNNRAIVFRGGGLYLENATISNNTNGGVYTQGMSTAFVSNSTFLGNGAPFNIGAAFHIDFISYITTTDVTFIGTKFIANHNNTNYAGFYGYGMGTTMNFIDCEFSQAQSGVVLVMAGIGNSIVKGCTFSQNYYCLSISQQDFIHISDSTFSDNTAGAADVGVTSLVENCKFLRNGGFAFATNYDAYTSFRNNTVKFNTGTGVYLSGNADIFGGEITNNTKGIVFDGFPGEMPPITVNSTMLSTELGFPFCCQQQIVFNPTLLLCNYPTCDPDKCADIVDGCTCHLISNTSAIPICGDCSVGWKGDYCDNETICGDGICDQSETCISCRADCPVCTTTTTTTTKSSTGNPSTSSPTTSSSPSTLGNVSTTVATTASSPGTASTTSTTSPSTTSKPSTSTSTSPSTTSKTTVSPTSSPSSTSPTSPPNIVNVTNNNNSTIIIAIVVPIGVLLLIAIALLIVVLMKKRNKDVKVELTDMR